MRLWHDGRRAICSVLARVGLAECKPRSRWSTLRRRMRVHQCFMHFSRIPLLKRVAHVVAFGASFSVLHALLLDVAIAQRAGARLRGPSLAQRPCLLGRGPFSLSQWQCGVFPAAGCGGPHKSVRRRLRWSSGALASDRRRALAPSSVRRQWSGLCERCSSTCGCTKGSGPDSAAMTVKDSIYDSTVYTHGRRTLRTTCLSNSVLC